MPLQRNLLVFLSGCSALLGSTFIVAKNGDEIVVGADSRVTLTIDYTKTRQGPDTCKIHKCARGRYFVVASNQFINIKTGVDFSELANQSCKASGDPKANADSFETKALAAAGRILKEDKQTTVLAVVFFGYDHGPFFYSRSIRVSPSEIYNQPVDCPHGCSQWIAGGYHELIDKLAPQAFSVSSIESAIPSLISKEIEADKTGGIGPPIAVFRLDASGEHWLSPGACRPFRTDRKGSTAPASVLTPCHGGVPRRDTPPRVGTVE